MKELKEIVVTVSVTAVLIFIIAFFICGTAAGQTREGNRKEEQYYNILEQTYVSEIRNLLEERGYRNSGVTMSRVRLEDGSNQYIVTIYHRRIMNLALDEQEELLDACRMIRFPVEDCNFFHEFLEADL